MKNLEYFYSEDLKEKLNALVKMSWELLQRKIQYGLISINKEASLQLQFAYILQELISISRFSNDENVKVVLEETVKIQDAKPQEVDVIVETIINNEKYKIAIEMKCYRTKTSSGGNRGAQDIFVKDVYEDIEVLENYKKSNKDIKKTFFLAMTDYQNFVFPKDKTAKYWDYDISDGFELSGPKDLRTPIGGKEVNIHIENTYHFDWTTTEGLKEYFFLCLE